MVVSASLPKTVAVFTWLPVSALSLAACTILSPLDGIVGTRPDSSAEDAGTLDVGLSGAAPDVRLDSPSEASARPCTSSCPLGACFRQQCISAVVADGTFLSVSSEFAMSSDGAYWTTSGLLYQSRGGGAGQLIASSTLDIWGIAQAGGSIYALATGVDREDTILLALTESRLDNVLSVTGESPRTLFSGQDQVVWLARDQATSEERIRVWKPGRVESELVWSSENRLSWASAGQGYVAYLRGSSPRYVGVLDSQWVVRWELGLDAQSLTLRGRYVFVATPNEVLRIAYDDVTDQTKSVVLPKSDVARGEFVANSTHLYWTECDAVESGPTRNCSVLRAPHGQTQAAAETVTSLQYEGVQVQVRGADDTFVWLATSSHLYSLRIAD